MLSAITIAYHMLCVCSCVFHVDVLALVAFVRLQMSRPPSKRSRLASLAGIPGVTSTGLQEVLQALRALPEGTDLDVSRRTLDRLYDDIASEVGLDLQILDLQPGSTFEGGPFYWHTSGLQKVLQYFCEKSEPFRRVHQSMFAHYGNSWRLVLYCDGVTPGAVLRPDVKKKVVVFYASFLELGPLLACSEFWLPLGVIRESVLKQLPGGLSMITRLVLRQAFLGNDGVQTTGVVCPIGANESPEIVFLSLGAVLGDEDALSAVWGIKGASGTVPCGVKCCVVSKTRGNQRSLALQDPESRTSDVLTSTRLPSSLMRMCGPRPRTSKEAGT